ncbi:hypothetical protein HMPREF9075_01568 [Capnocytophaga sp. oral taxon 332 str. F0381]|nr:hypothetical protein HMPREF9075_01568 [Capnocytophaga sp. oral taxon 332 str. F0381]
MRAAQAFIFRHILGCASSPTFLRSSFAYPSLKLCLKSRGKNTKYF